MLLALLLAAACSIALTALTVNAPTIPSDWARLDASGIYIPHPIAFAWPSYAAQVGLWVAMVGALWFTHPTPRPHFSQGTFVPVRVARIQGGGGNLAKSSGIFVIAILTMVGFGLRVHSLTALPLIIDEIGFAAQASDILHGQHVPIFAPGHNANPSVYSWLVAGVMSLFGQNSFAIRLMPLFFGTLSIPAVYLLGREWWSRRVGLVAAAFLATYPAHIFYSRMSLYNLVDPVFAMLTLAFLARAMRRGAARDYVLAGMMMACAQYFYHGSRLVLLLAIGYWLFNLTPRPPLHWMERGCRTSMFYRALWMALAFGLMALPRFAPALVGGLPLEGNREAMRLPADFVPENTLRAVLAWIGQPDVSPFWLSDAPLLLWPALALFVIGLGYSIWRWRDGRYAMLLAWVMLTTIFGGTIWTAAPLYVRYMTAVPAIALLVAGGLSAVSGQRSENTLNRQDAADSKNIFKNYLANLASWRLTIFLVFVCLQGVVAAWEQPPEALSRVTPSQWIEDELARQAASLPEEISVVLVVPREFGDIQLITIAHYLAAYGQRRALAVNRDQPELLASQIGELPQPVEVLTSCQCVP
jgi:4-amino-4-deoxy-L-arabinose transferase-like glycosyltransferase